MKPKVMRLLKSLTYDTNTVKVYLVLAFVNVLVVGIMGIIYGVNLYSQKVAYLTSLETQRTEMSQKLAQLKELKSSYDSANLYMDTFNKIMPTSVDFENYIVPFTNTLAQNGFLVTGMNHTSGFGADNAIISATIEGDYFNVPKMLQAIESLPRITDVQSINISTSSLSMPVFMKVYFISTPDIKEGKK